MAIDYKKFGSLVKHNRRSMKYTQKDVYSLTGISVETQRLLENGLREPRVTTLQRLSEVYKVDLIHLLYRTRMESDFFSDKFLEDVGNAMNRMDYDAFKNKLEELVTTIELEYLNDGHKTEKNMKFLASLQVLKDVRIDEYRYNMSNTVFIEQMLEYFSKDKMTILSDRNLYNIEIQLAILLAIMYRQSANFEKAEQLLDTIIRTLETIDDLTIKQMDYLVATYFNLAYVYHRKDRHEDIIELVTKVLGRDDLRIKRTHYSCLLLRLAVAQYSLNNPNYVHTFAHLMMLDPASRTRPNYERTLEAYGIDMADFMDMRDVSGFEHFYDSYDGAIWPDNGRDIKLPDSQ